MRGWARLRGVVILGGIVAVLFGAARAIAGPCDEYNPGGPALIGRVTLDSRDFTDEMRDQMRTFIATDSIGKVDVAIVSERPGNAVGVVSALPEVSRFSPYHGEELKGIAIVATMRPHAGPVRVTLRLRQVCAKYFRDTFLYY